MTSVPYDPALKSIADSVMRYGSDLNGVQGYGRSLMDCASRLYDYLGVPESERLSGGARR